MGQCYTVKAKFYFKDDDPTSFCNAIKAYVHAMDGDRANFGSYKESDFDTPFGCFSVICPNAYDYGEYYCADFDASYGWEIVLEQAFRTGLKECDDGSHVDVYPDNGMWSLNVEDGEVVEI